MVYSSVRVLQLDIGIIQFFLLKHIYHQLLRNCWIVNM